MTGSLLPVKGSQGYLLIRASFFGPPCGLRGLLRQLGRGKCVPILTRPRHCVCVRRSSCGVLEKGKILFRLGLFSLSNTCNSRTGRGTR